VDEEGRVENIMKNKFLITFAGAVGSSKTPIAHYLSWKLNFPIFSNDAIRTEVTEDFGLLNDAEYIKRRDNRLEEIIKSGLSFIYDASVDREWVNLKQELEVYGYQTFIISLDLSKELLTSLYKIKGYHETLVKIENFIADHENFLKQYSDVVGLHLLDNEFEDRLDISYQKVKNWISQK
jgi:hypothetical protein